MSASSDVPSAPAADVGTVLSSVLALGGAEAPFVVTGVLTPGGAEVVSRWRYEYEVHRSIGLEGWSIRSFTTTFTLDAATGTWRASDRLEEGARCAGPGAPPRTRPAHTMTGRVTARSRHVSPAYPDGNLFDAAGNATATFDTALVKGPVVEVLEKLGWQRHRGGLARLLGR